MKNILTQVTSVKPILEFLYKSHANDVVGYDLPYVIVMVYDGDNDNYEDIIRRSKNIFDETTCFENPKFINLPGWVVKVEKIHELIKNLQVNKDSINNHDSQNEGINLDIFKLPKMFETKKWCSASKIADLLNAGIEHRLYAKSQQEFDDEWKNKEYYNIKI